MPKNATIILVAGLAIGCTASGSPDAGDVSPSLLPQSGTVTGQVTHMRTGLPVPRVQVFFSDSGRGGVTQQNGRYLLQNVPTGTHTLIANRVRYRAVEAQVAVSDDQTVEQNFVIEPE
jgi:hypothetical protein